jgi:hypothetical protein
MYIRTPPLAPSRPRYVSQSMDRRLNRLRVVGNVDNGTEHATKDGSSGGAGGGGGG